MVTQDIPYETLLDQLNDGVLFIDRDHVITYWNKGAERITGYPRPEVVGMVCARGFLQHFNEEGNPAFQGSIHPLLVCLKDGVAREMEVFLLHKNGGKVPVFARVSPIINSLGEIIGALEVFSDNTSKVVAKQRIQELEELALICPLTGVGNRRYAEMALQNAFDELQRFAWEFGVCFVDLDHFKKVNDNYGHNVGDQVLRMAALALRNGLRSFDFVGRWGGEEFMVLLPNINMEVLNKIAERCRSLIESSEFQVDGHPVQVTASMGAVIARPEETPESLIERADRLMYASKMRGRNCITFDS